MKQNLFSKATVQYSIIFRKCLFKITFGNSCNFDALLCINNDVPTLEDVAALVRFHENDETLSDAVRFVVSTIYALHLLSQTHMKLMWAILTRPKYEIALSNYSTQSRSRKFREAEESFFKLISNTGLLKKMEKLVVSIDLNDTDLDALEQVL